MGLLDFTSSWELLIIDAELEMDPNRMAPFPFKQIFKPLFAETMIAPLIQVANLLRTMTYPPTGPKEMTECLILD